MTLPTLFTTRLVLRQIKLEDAAALHVILSDRQTMKWWSRPPTNSVEETRDYVKWNASVDPQRSCWAITGTKDGPALGWVVTIGRRQRVKEIGYILCRDHWGSGLMNEAVSAVVAYEFDTQNVRRLFADTDPENAASIKLLQSLGFKQEGHLRAEWETHMGVRDSLIFGLLATDPRGAKKIDMIS